MGSFASRHCGEGLAGEMRRSTLLQKLSRFFDFYFFVTVTYLAIISGKANVRPFRLPIQRQQNSAFMPIIRALLKCNL